MKIFLDCTFLKNTHTGVDSSFLNLIENIFLLDNSNHYIILINTKYNTEALLKAIGMASNFKIIKLYSRFILQVFYSSFVIPFFLRYYKIDVYHNPFFFGPLLRFISPSTKVVITVYDMYYRTVPKMMGNKYLSTVFRVFAEPAIKNADEIIVISKQTEADLIHFINPPINKVNLIYVALVNKFEQKLSDINLGKFEITKKNYILTVGTLQPSKALDDLIRAFAILIKKHSHDDLCLVSVGLQFDNYINKIESLIASLDVGQTVKILGYVTNEELNALYQNASLFVLPSHYEGFGLPILEAMKFRVPVIARNASSLIEIVKDAGLLFNNNEELAEQMHLLLTDKVLRDDLLKKGDNRVKDFSWVASAEKTIAVYNKKKLNYRQV